MTAALPEAQQAAYRDAIPAGRFASAAEVAGVVRFVASDEAAYISGAVVPVSPCEAGETPLHLVSPL